jgi:leucyl aminopeptidase
MGLTSFAFSLEHTGFSSERMGSRIAARAAAEAGVLASWDFREMKTVGQDEKARGLEEMVLITDSAQREVEEAVHIGAVSASAANFARDLATRPGNVATPTYLANAAREIADAHGMKLTVLDREQMRAEGMHSLLAVAQGSEEEPRFIALEYNGGADGAQPLVLIGKGVTFDSGGISIKPADRMEEMKYDMCGAAAVLGAMRGIADLKIKANVVGLIPSTENLPSGTAVKPGDVIGSHLGKTIEVINTDAEGRLILVDALSYARRYKPAAMIDAATLTGAVVIALGHQAIGLMGNDGDLIDEIMAAGLRSGERCWNLPLWDEYRELLDSNIADIKNSGGRAAGTITGGWFLKDFVADDIPWAHLDIAGVAWRDDAPPYLRKGATGWPTRLFIEWVRSRAKG